MNIRNCEKADLIAYAELFVEVFSEPPYNEKWSIRDAKAYIKRFWRIEPESCLVAEKDGGTEGVLLGFSYPWQNRKDFTVQELFVRKKARRQGIARALIGCVLEDFPIDTAVSLVVNEKADAAIFYERLGLSQNKQNKFYSGHIRND